ncbi:MAG: insulinase family protein, partial [Calditrichia bacterium]|nr:insulinase family protein [Calditrichia bacterium]
QYTSDVPAEPTQKETRYYHLQNSSIPPFLMLSYKGPAFNDQEIDMPAMDVISTILFSENSALYKKLVIEEQKVRFIGGGAFDSKDPNLFSIQASLINKEDMQYVKDEVVKALEAVKENGVDEKLLADTKSHLKYSFAMQIDNPDQIAGTLCHYIALTGDPGTINRVYQQYDKVSVNDIKDITRKFFIPTGLTISTITGDPEGGVQ